MNPGVRERIVEIVAAASEAVELVEVPARTFDWSKSGLARKRCRIARHEFRPVLPEGKRLLPVLDECGRSDEVSALKGLHRVLEVAGNCMLMLGRGPGGKIKLDWTRSSAFDSQAELTDKECELLAAFAGEDWAEPQLDKWRDKVADVRIYALAEKVAFDLASAIETLRSLGYGTAEEPETAQEPGYLGLVVRPTERRVDRMLTARFYGQDRVWALFHALYEVGDRGLTMDEVHEKVWKPDKVDDDAVRVAAKRVRETLAKAEFGITVVTPREGGGRFRLVKKADKPE